jgi:hypothetical protein
MFTTANHKTFRLRTGAVECDERGLRVGGISLLASAGAPLAKRSWRALPAAELDLAMSRAYGFPIRAQKRTRAFEVVAEALNNGELARAQIAALLLQLPDPPVLGRDAPNGPDLAAQLEELGLLTKDWNPDEHPRTGTPPNPGWFAPKDDAGASAAVEPNSGPSDNGLIARTRQYAFSGTLFDKRYDEVGGWTHCWYTTPVGQFAIEFQGYARCPPTWPYPF